LLHVRRSENGLNHSVCPTFPDTFSITTTLVAGNTPSTRHDRLLLALAFSGPSNVYGAGFRRTWESLDTTPFRPISAPCQGSTGDSATHAPGVRDYASLPPFFCHVCHFYRRMHEHKCGRRPSRGWEAGERATSSPTSTSARVSCRYEDTPSNYRVALSTILPLEFCTELAS
jgi:hypothetical protein